jgi:hypothetical protein
MINDKPVDTKPPSPDVIAGNLVSRLRWLESELKRLKQDRSSSEEQINATVLELALARVQVEELHTTLRHALALLRDYPLSTFDMTGVLFGDR